MALDSSLRLFLRGGSVSSFGVELSLKDGGVSVSCPFTNDDLVPVMRIAATMCRGPLLELLSRRSTLMLQVPLVGAMASHVQWATALTCGSHVFVTSVGPMHCGDDVLFELLTGFQ